MSQRSVLAVLLALAVLVGVASHAVAADPSTGAASFPESWFGHWKGDARALGGQVEMRFGMELIVGPGPGPDRFQWTIVYDGASGRQERPYELVVRDREKGLFAIDEKNGIVIESRFVDDTLFSLFEVEGTRIATRERLMGAGGNAESIEVEMVVTSVGDPAVSGGDGGAPEVRSWAPKSIQRATLRRVAPATASALPAWVRLATEPYKGKQDDIFFVTPELGWYVNGAGKIFKTTDGGTTWTEKAHKPGTYFRCIAFVDDKVGVAGNIGPGYFPNVSDATPLYRTVDGGDTWAPVTEIEGEPVVGLCAIEVLREEIVNAGKLDTRTRLHAVGRVGGPVAFLYSDDLGATWKRRSLPESAAMAFDVHFFDRDHGVVAAGSSANVAESNALILTTADGGATWTEAYRSARPYELTWKIAFPTRDVGYVTVQSYNPDPTVTARVVAKTTDGGKTWTELPLASDAKVRAFGVAFLDASRGWVGAMPHGFETTDGGATWNRVDFGNAVNKIRVLPAADGTHAFAIGTEVWKTFVPK
ncbi:MAG: hypothetical protein JNM94_08255 [Phycisphaerae bacterium]|nr:hypothetical protein [Phycisphaerae bacterium]